MDEPCTQTKAHGNMLVGYKSHPVLLWDERMTYVEVSTIKPFHATSFVAGKQMSELLNAGVSYAVFNVY